MFTPVQLNQRSYDFTSVRCSGLPAGFDSRLFTAHLRGLNFSEAITPSLPRGVHGIPLPRGRGYYTTQTSMEVVWDAWDAFTKNLAARGLQGYSDFDFSMVVSYKAGQSISTVEWRQCSILNAEASHAQGGSDGLTARLTCHTRFILTNGVCAYALDLDQDLSSVGQGGVVVGL